MTPPLRVGFVGLGDQGAPMARAIAEAGYRLAVWARRPSSVEALAGLDFTVADSVNELGRTCDLVGICVSSAEDVEEVLFRNGLATAMTAGSVVAVHSTISPKSNVDLARRAAEVGVIVLDAPVSGGGESARRKSLLTILGGDEAAARRCWSVFESFSSKVVHVGPSGRGQMSKLVNNAMVVANLRTAALALFAATELGFDLASLIEVVQAGTGASAALDVLHNRMAPSMLSHHIDLLSKDVDTFRDLLERSDIDDRGLSAYASGAFELLSSALALPGACRND